MAENVVREALTASWKIVANDTGETIRSGKNTICLDEISGWQSAAYATLIKANQWGLIGSMKDRTVRIQNNNSFDVELWIGDNHSHTDQTLDEHSTLIWRFKGFHAHGINTQHWAKVKRDGSRKARFSVYGDGDYGDAPRDNNTFKIGKSKINSSFGTEYPVNFN